MKRREEKSKKKTRKERSSEVAVVEKSWTEFDVSLGVTCLCVSCFVLNKMRVQRFLFFYILYFINH